MTMLALVFAVLSALAFGRSELGRERPSMHLALGACTIIPTTVLLTVLSIAGRDGDGDRNSAAVAPLQGEGGCSDSRRF